LKKKTAKLLEISLQNTPVTEKSETSHTLQNDLEINLLRRCPVIFY